MNYLFVAKNITKVVPCDRHILTDVSFSLPQSGMVGLIGPSGSGKTTLLNLLSGLDKGEGVLLYQGMNLFDVASKELDNIRNRDFSIIFQNYNLFNGDSVYDNIYMAAYFQGKKVGKDEIEEVLKKVNLEGYEKRKISTLSGGEMARVALARALIRQSKVIFADEITANLDQENSISVLNLLKKISQNILIVLATHDNLAMTFCDSKIKLAYGKVVEIDPVLRGEKNSLKNTSEKANSAFAGLKFLLRDFKNSVFKSKILFSCILIVMTVLFSLLTTMFSLNQVSMAKAYCSTFQKNERYLVSANYYEESNQKISYPWGDEYSGVVMDTEDEHNTKEELDTFIGNTNSSAVAYHYDCPFNSFFDSSVSNVSDDFYTNEFTQFIAVSDFSSFHTPLSWGRMPEKEDEFLIFDYAFDSLSFFHLIDQEQWDYLLCDSNQMVMKVVGIMKSNYKDYQGLKKLNKYMKYDLFDFSSIIGFTSYVDKYQRKEKESFVFSALSAEKTDDEGHDQKLCDVNCRVFVKKYSQLSEFSFEARYENEACHEGVIISKKTAMNWVGCDDEKNFDETVFGDGKKGSEGVVHKCSAQSSLLISSSGLCEKETIDYGFPILGITNDLENEMVTLVVDDKSSYDIGLFLNLFSFRNCYLSLSLDWSQNEKLINRMLLPKSKTNEEYDALPEDYFTNGFAINTGLTYIVDKADDYLKTVSNVAKNVLNYMVAVVAVFIFYFAFSSIKNNYYQIGIYKSFGLSNVKIALSSFFSGVFVCCISYGLSVIAATIILSAINADFVADLGVGLTFISLTGLSLIYSLLIGMAVLIVGMMIPLFKLIFSKPINLVKENLK